MLPLWLGGTHILLAWLLWRRRGANRKADDAVNEAVQNAAAPTAAAAQSAEHCATEVNQSPAAATAAATAAAPRAPQPRLAHPHADLIQQLCSQPPPLQPTLTPWKHEDQDTFIHSFTWVDTVPKLAAAAMELYEQDRTALDVEHHSTHTYSGLTCLVQLSTGEWQQQRAGEEPTIH